MGKVTGYIERQRGGALAAMLFGYVVLAGVLSWPLLRFVPDEWHVQVVLAVQLLALTALVFVLRRSVER